MIAMVKPRKYLRFIDPTPGYKGQSSLSFWTLICPKFSLMQYFFLTEGWHIGRVWEPGGPWDILSWRRPPKIQRTNIAMENQGERLWLYQVDDPILMLEVTPDPTKVKTENIGQVMIKRLITPEEAIAQLNQANTLYKDPTPSH